MYTEVYVNVDLKKETPNEVLSVLAAMCEDGDKRALDVLDKPEKWKRLFYDGSFYTPLTSSRNLTYNEHNNSFSLLGKGDIQNREGEIQQFFDWIKPWVVGSPGDFIGYWRYEEDQVPELVFLD